MQIKYISKQKQLKKPWRKFQKLPDSGFEIPTYLLASQNWKMQVEILSTC